MQDLQAEDIKTKINGTMESLRELINNGFITKRDILNLFSEEAPQEMKEGSGRVVKTLYFIGGVIVILGVGIFMFQFWAHWGQGLKVFFSLSLTGILYGIGYYFHNKDPKFSIFSNISFILSALIMPLGVGTFLDLIGSSATKSAGLSINFAILFLWYFLSYWFLKYNVFLLFAALTASGLFITFTNLLIGGRPTAAFYEYRLLILGASLFSFSYYLKDNKKEVINIFYFFGLALFLGSAFALSIEESFWQFLFPFMIAGAFYSSHFLKNKVVLFLATIFTFVEIGYLTAKYFSQSLGWPIALIVAGFSIILVGYLSYGVGKKYAKQ